jgi:hypothetical protein
MTKHEKGEKAVRTWERVVLPILYLVKDGLGTSLEAGWCESLDGMWEVAEHMLAENLERKRIVFFGSDLIWINALARPGYLKQEQDRISPQDQEMLQRVIGSIPD